jgi:hypothetical protein
MMPTTAGKYADADDVALRPHAARVFFIDQPSLFASK